MTVKRFTVQDEKVLKDNQKYVAENGYVFSYKSDAEEVCNLLNELYEENKRLKAQLYCDDEEGVCNICKHHYLVSDDESEWGYYNSRCRKGHSYECARVSLKYCEDFEKEVEE